MKMPWSVKGVDAQARDVAKDAARRAGMTLGEWLNTMIVETATDEPEPPRARHGHEPQGHNLKDIAERLARLDRAAADTALGAHHAQSDLESVLRRAIADTTKRADVVEERTAGALSAMVRWMEHAEQRRREEVGTIAAAQERTSTALRDALALVATRMNDIERTVATRDSDPGVKEALARLELRIDRLDERESAAPVPPRIEKALRDLETRLVAVAGRIGTEAQPSQREQAERIETIETALASILDRLDMAREEDEAAVAGTPGSLDEAMAQIRARQATLDRPAAAGRRAAAPAPQAVADGIVDSLKGDIAQLSLRIDELRDVTQRNTAHQDGRAGRDVAALRGDLADLTAAVKTLAPQTRLDAIEDGLSALGDRLDGLRRESGARALAEPLESIGVEMGRIGQALEPLRTLADLRADIAALGRRLDRVQAQPDARALAEITAGIESLKGGIADAVRGADAVSNLEKRLGSIDATLARLAQGRDDAAGAGAAAIRSAADDIRAAVASLQGPDLGGVETRLKAIEERFDAAPAPVLAAADEIRAAVAGLRAPDLGGVESRLQAIEEAFRRAPAPHLSVADDVRAAVAGIEFPDLGIIENRLQTIIGRLDVPPPPAQAAVDTGELEGLIRGLGEKIDAAGRSEATPASFEALERQIAAMTDALGRNDESFAALRSMERSIADLFVRFEDGRLAVVEAAEAAAMKAAQTVSGSIAAPAPDDRASQALDAVQATLGRIVERLARLEAGIEAQQQAASAAAPAAAPEPRPAAPSVAEKIAAAAAAARAAKLAEPPAKSRATATAPAPTPGAVTPAAADVEDARQLVASARASAEKAMLSLAPPAAAEAVVADEPAPAEIPSANTAQARQAEQSDEELIAAAVAAATRAEAAGLTPAVLAEDRPLEPGTGRPVLPPAAEPEAEAGPEGPAPRKPSFIAAARAAVASQPRKAARPSSLRPERKTDAAEPAADGADAAPGMQAGSFLERKRRPILIGLAIVVLALGTAQIVRTMLLQNANRDTAPPAAQQESGALPAKPAPEPSVTGAIPPVTLPAPVLLDPPTAPAQPSFNNGARPAPPADGFVQTPRAEPDTVGALGTAPQGAPSPALTDPDPVGTPALNDIARALLPTGLQKAARSGNPVAAYDVALRMLDGKGVPRDPKAAIKWLEKAAAGGLAPAEYRLGSLYEKGTGVPVDLVKARAFYQRAADRGNAKAMHNLGVLIADSASGKPDYATAAAWFRRAADLGVRDSQYNLAILAARGLGMQQNLGESYVWFTIAAAQGDEDAGRKREEVAARLDAAALATAKAAAAGFQPRKPDDAANEVAMPASWDDITPAAAPAKGKGRG
jgi:localization factor PodJL